MQNRVTTVEAIESLSRGLTDAAVQAFSSMSEAGRLTGASLVEMCQTMQLLNDCIGKKPLATMQQTVVLIETAKPKRAIALSGWS